MSEIKKRKININPVLRKAQVRAESVDVDERTVDVIFSTGAQVLRGGFFTEPFMEELSLDPSHVRLERLNNGAPLLNNHSQRDLNDVIGVVESASVDGKVGVATVRFSKREDVEPIFQDVKDGIIRNISIGYRIYKFEESGRTDDDLKIYRAIDWEPIEISAVTAPADDGAKFRSDVAGLGENVCDIIEKIETKVDDEEQNQLDQRNDPVETIEKENKVDEQPAMRQDQNHSMGEQMTNEERKALQDEAIKSERKRQADIKDAVRKAGLETGFADELCASEVSVDEARQQIIEKLAEAQKETETRQSGLHIEMGETELEKVKRGVENAIQYKAGNDKLSDHGKEFRGLGLVGLAREVLTAQGFNLRGMTASNVADLALNNKTTSVRGGMHTTSDFPEILANVANKSLRDAYETSPATWRTITREVTTSDFKEMSRTQLGEGEKLEKVPEGGEIRKATISEGAEKYSLATFAKIYVVSRQMLINDDLSAFSRLPQILGRRVADLDSDLVWDIIKNNPLMADGNALFSSAHANLAGAGGAIADATLSAFRSAMRQQIGLDGQKLGLVPRVLAVPTALETVAEKELAVRQPDSSAGVGPFSAAGRTPLELVVEPRLDDDSAISWYGFADIGQIDIIELARLEGESGPVIESMDGFDIEGMKIKVRYDAAAKALDHRGAYKNPGA